MVIITTRPSLPLRYSKIHGCKSCGIGIIGPTVYSQNLVASLKKFVYIYSSPFLIEDFLGLARYHFFNVGNPTANGPFVMQKCSDNFGYYVAMGFGFRDFVWYLNVCRNHFTCSMFTKALLWPEPPISFRGIASIKLKYCRTKLTKKLFGELMYPSFKAKLGESRWSIDFQAIVSSFF